MKRRKIARIATVMGISASMIFATACGGQQQSGTNETKKETAQESVAEGESGEENKGGTSEFSGKEIEIATYLSGDSLTAYKDIISGFENETGVKVILDEYGNDYESTMKTRMASNDLPDVFETHGWSLIRYKEYLEDLSNEAWAAELSKAALGVI